MQLKQYLQKFDSFYAYIRKQSKKTELSIPSKNFIKRTAKQNRKENIIKIRTKINKIEKHYRGTTRLKMVFFEKIYEIDNFLARMLK